MEFYAVAHHGTAGLGNSYGYAEIVAIAKPRSDHTTTVSGPYETEAQAQAEVDRMDGEEAAFRASQD